MSRGLAAAICVALGSAGCDRGTEGDAGGTGAFFVDVAAESGIEFVHTHGGAEEYHLIETMGAGGAFLDYDGDGYLDVYLVNGFSWKGSATSSPR